MEKTGQVPGLVIAGVAIVLQACQGGSKTPAAADIDALNLKKGAIISCGPPEQEFGTVWFETSCPARLRKDFDLAIALLHSFEYDEAEKAFANIIDKAPSCAMAYWGVAMSNYHTLWAPPTPAELDKGAKAIAVAQSLSQKSKRESDYIEALALFYRDRDKIDHVTRSRKFEQAMQKIYTNYPEDKEAPIFYALTLIANADPADKTYTRQKEAVAILRKVYEAEPDHPGIIHYIIHAYDNPELAMQALPEARKYASIAPSSAHAQHMPSHIFTRLGLWEEDVQSNLAAAASAKCYAENTGIKGHWDEELHSLDYLVYSYLQMGDNSNAKQQCDYLKAIDEVFPVNFKVAYAFAAIPARYVLENKQWKEAATLELHPVNFPWNDFPWQKAIYYFTRLLGAVHTGDRPEYETELKKLQVIHDTLVAQHDSYKANQVQIQLTTAKAWILWREGKNNEAIKMMTEAAGMEDNTQKHPVTPGEVLPARELLGDMLLLLNKPAEALIAYEADLKEHPNRLNGLKGAALAAEKSGNQEKLNLYRR